MRIVFIGTVDFSYHCLKAMLDMKADIVGIFTQKRADARNNADWSDLSALAGLHHVPVFYFRKVSDKRTLNRIRDLRPDIVFVLGLSQLLPPEFLGIAPMGVIGSHPALLPRNRGRHPLIWALAKGLKRSGLTLFFIDEGTDTGDIILQREFEIRLTDTASDLYGKIKGLGIEMLRELIPLLEKERAPRIPQNDNRATYLRKRDKNDGLIRWEAGAMNAYNLIRALTHPYVGAHTIIKNDEVKVWRARPPESPTMGNTGYYVPGEIVSVQDGEVGVWANDGILCITGMEMNAGNLKIGEAFS